MNKPLDKNEAETGTAVAVAEPKPVPRPPLDAGARVAAIIPRDIDQVARIANAVIVAGLAPDSYKGGDDKATASKIMIGIMKGAEIGLPPLTALANIAIINGRPCLWGDGAVALIQASGKVSKWTEHFEGEDGADDYVAICEIMRTGQSEPYVGRFSMADAKRARLLSKGPWQQYPSRMLMWRARTYAMRTGFADCLSGLSLAEEIQDLPPPPKPVDHAFLEDAAQIEGEVTDAALAPEVADEDLHEYLDVQKDVAASLDKLASLDELNVAVRKVLAGRDDMLREWAAVYATKHRDLSKLKSAA